MRSLIFLLTAFLAMPGRAQLHVSKGSEVYLEKEAFIIVYHDVQQEEAIRGEGPVEIIREPGFKLIRTGTDVYETISNNNRIKFALYPNPARAFTTLNVFSLFQSKANICLYDVSGKRLLSKNLLLNATDNIYQLDLSAIFPGAYTITIEHSSGKISRRVIVK